MFQSSLVVISLSLATAMASSSTSISIESIPISEPNNLDSPNIGNDCLSLIASANATNSIPSIEQLNTTLSSVNPKTYNVSLAITVNAPSPLGAMDLSPFVQPYSPHSRPSYQLPEYLTNPTINSTIWLSVDKAVDYSRPDLPFSACALAFQGLPSTANQMSISPDGSCKQTFSEGCTRDLETLAADIAWNFTRKHARSKGYLQTYGRLQEVCSDLEKQMMIALPSSCRGFENENGRLWETASSIGKQYHCLQPNPHLQLFPDPSTKTPLL